MKNCIVLSLMFALFFSSAYAQNNKLVFSEVKGTVFNNFFDSIGDVSVTIYNSKNIYQTHTDSNGNYTFTQIPLGNYRMSFKKENLRSEYDTLIIIYTSNLIIKNKILGDLYYSSNCHFYTNTSYGNIIPNFVPPSITYINKAPNQNPNAIAAYVRGVDSRNVETPSIKGSRPENTAYYIDGVRVAGIEENYNIIGK